MKSEMEVAMARLALELEIDERSSGRAPGNPYKLETLRGELRDLRTKKQFADWVLDGTGAMEIEKLIGKGREKISKMRSGLDRYNPLFEKDSSEISLGDASDKPADTNGSHEIRP